MSTSPTPHSHVPELSLEVVRSFEINLGGVPFVLTELEDESMDHYWPKYRQQALGLPLNLVCGMANASFLSPGQASQILAALSPFQVLSKLWATQIAAKAVSQEVAQQQEQFIFPGSWYGQQMALMRRDSFVRMLKPLLIDQDAEATFVARSLLQWDDYTRGQDKQEAVVLGMDIFGEAIDRNPDWLDRSRTAVYVWNGLEHFDPVKTRAFIASESGATFCLQSTNMEASDHQFKCENVLQMLDYVPNDRRRSIQYLGELESPMGSRFMVVFG